LSTSSWPASSPERAEPNKEPGTVANETQTESALPGRRHLTPGTLLAEII
jgi:hypothetical protein